MKRLYFTFIFLTFLYITLFAQWVQKASMENYGRTSAIGCCINGKGYVGLGKIFNNTYVNDFWEYDTFNNIWIKKADYPGAGLYESTSFVINNKLYVCLGFSNSMACQNDLWEYNPANDIWTKKADFPGRARYGARAFVLGDSAFVVSGSYNNATDYLYDTYMYNPTTNSWKRKANFVGGSRSNGTAFSIGEFGYFGLGLSNYSTTKNDFWKYNATTDSWSAITNFIGSPRNAPVNFVIDNKAYVGCGSNSTSESSSTSSVYYNDFYVYDPVTNIWQLCNTSSTTFPVRSAAIAFSSENTGYVGLGINLFTGYKTDLWSIHFDPLTSIIVENTAFKIYTNSLNSSVSIENNSGVNEKYILTITGLDGRNLLMRNIEIQNFINIELPHLKNGVYVLSLKNEKRQIVQKILI